MKKFKILSAYILSLTLLANIFVFLQPNQASAACVFLSTSLRYQESDSTTSGQVSVLQNFLSSSGYLSSSATGYFGNLTLAAVKSFQTANGIPATGFVGPLTKDKIGNISCGNVTGGSNGGIITTNAVCGPGALFNTITGAPCSGSQVVTVCGPGALFNTITGAPCGSITNTSFSLSSYVYSNNDNSSSIDNTIYDSSNGYNYNVYISCPSGVSVTYLGSNACGNINLYYGTRRFTLLAYNSSGSTKNLSIRVSALNSSGGTLAVDTENVSIPSRSNLIEVTNPSSGQSYAIGESMNIRWNASSFTSNVIIELVKGSSVYGTISYSAQNTGSFTWTIPAIAPVGNDNKIRITDTYNTSNYDDSNGQFSITQSAYSSKSINTFNLTTPSATGVIDETNRIITLNVPFGTNVTSLAPVITTSGNSTVTPASGVAQNFTSYKDYVVRAQDGTTQTYRVTVNFASASTDKAITGFSFANPSATGSINESAKTISVSYPVGTAVTSLAPTIVVSPNATVSPLSGVAQNFSTPKTYTVRAQDGSLQPYVVTVSVAQPYLTLTSPNNGGSFQRGTNVHVAWESLGVSNIKVELWNGATKIGEIPLAVPATNGSIDYTLPMTAPLGSNYKIKIIDTTNSTRFDLSEASFSVTENTSAQGFTFISPASGSDNFVGKPLSINWTTTGYVPNVGVSYIKGTATTSLTAFTPNTGTYTWNVLTGQATGDDYSIFIYNTVNGNVFAYSPKFKMIVPNITVTAPSNTAIAKGTNMHVAWTATSNVSKVKIELFKGTALATGITNPLTPEILASAGSADFFLPTTLLNGSDYYVKVTDTASTLTDKNDLPFTVATALPDSKQITSFNLTAPATTGTINETNKTVTLAIPGGIGQGVTVNPVITLSSTGATVSPASGAPVTFTTTNPTKTYRVTAQDGSFQDYTVTLISK